MEYSKRIAADLMQAMKNKEANKLDALRALKTAFILAKSSVSAQAELSDEEELKIIQKLVKQRKDSATEFAAQNRNDLAEKELQEADVLSEYLPKQLSESEIEVVVKSLIQELGVSSVKEMGKVMGAASKQLAGKADGKLISEIVKKLLS